MHRRLALVLSGRANRALVIGAAGLALAACQDASTSPHNPGSTGVGIVTHESPTTSSNPLASFTFYIDQASKARQTADAWRTSSSA